MAILYSNFRGSSRLEQKKCLKYVAGEYHEDFFPLYTRLQLKATENNNFRDKPEHDMNQIMQNSVLGGFWDIMGRESEKSRVFSDYFRFFPTLVGSERSALRSVELGTQTTRSPHAASSCRLVLNKRWKYGRS